MWLLELEVPREAGAIFADLLSEATEDFSAFESQGGKGWRFAAYFAEKPALVPQAALAAAAAGIAAPALRLSRLPARDWLAANRLQFPPVRAGRFFIHGSGFGAQPPAGAIVLRLDAGLAFGTGTHQSTRGCLLALDRLARRRRPRRILDLGCGSGILALAAARLWRRRVLAADIDPVALQVTRANAKRNGLGAAIVTLRVRAGAPLARRRGRRRFDLVLANILARPLTGLAPALAEASGAGARIVLAGLLAEQASGVIAAYRRSGVVLERRLLLAPWMTLILRKAGRRAATLRT